MNKNELSIKLLRMGFERSNEYINVIASVEACEGLFEKEEWCDTLHLFLLEKLSAINKVLRELCNSATSHDELDIIENVSNRCRLLATSMRSRSNPLVAE